MRRRRPAPTPQDLERMTVAEIARLAASGAISLLAAARELDRRAHDRAAAR